MRRAVLPALAALALAAAAQLDPPMQYLAPGRTVDSLLARRPARLVAGRPGERQPSIGG